MTSTTESIQSWIVAVLSVASSTTNQGRTLLRTHPFAALFLAIWAVLLFPMSLTTVVGSTLVIGAAFSVWSALAVIAAPLLILTTALALVTWASVIAMFTVGRTLLRFPKGSKKTDLATTWQKYSETMPGNSSNEFRLKQPDITAITKNMATRLGLGSNDPDVPDALAAISELAASQDAKANPKIAELHALVEEPRVSTGTVPPTVLDPVNDPADPGKSMEVSPTTVPPTDAD